MKRLTVRDKLAARVAMGFIGWSQEPVREGHIAVRCCTCPAIKTMEKQEYERVKRHESEDL